MTRSIGLAVWALLAAACGAGQTPAAEAPLSDGALDAWGAGPEAPEAATAPDGEAPRPIELAGGERFRMLAALIAFDATPGGTGGGTMGGDRGTAPLQGQAASLQCALYALRAGTDGLEEARTRIACPADRSAALDRVERLHFRAVEADRGAHLRAVLSGATAGSSEAAVSAEGSPQRRVTLRLLTNRRMVESEVPSLAWPDPWDPPQPAMERYPESLAEMWEAVMYPQRYRNDPH